MMIHPALYLKPLGKKGRGVFTAETLIEGLIIEITPVIVMSLEDRKHLDQTLLHDYIFEWGVLKDKCAMALGHIPLYNHSYTSNCEYFMDYDQETMFVKTVRTINPDEEITINYNGDWDDATPVWFEVREK